jgi:murein DD-endopeptidase
MRSSGVAFSPKSSNFNHVGGLEMAEWNNTYLLKWGNDRVIKKLAKDFRNYLSVVPLATCLLLMATPLHAESLTVNVPRNPSPLPTAEGHVLVYELNVRNTDPQSCAKLIDVKASGGSGASLIEQHYQGDAIPANTLAYTRDMEKAPPGASGSVDVPPGGGVVVYFFIRVADSRPLPPLLHHTLAFRPCAVPGGVHAVAYDVPIDSARPLVVGLPFSGDGWVAGDSVNPNGVHRRTLIPVRDASGKKLPGQFHVPERYAIDWVISDNQGRRAVGDVHRNQSYLAFGKQVLAVADGVIAGTRDGYPEQTPPKIPPNGNEQMAAGNYIMEKLGDQQYAFYAHLQPGSLLVKQGDRVKRGQPIALLGNTGNSSEPHLHFHVSDRPDPLQSEGVPYVFDHFAQTGQVGGMNESTGVFDETLWHVPEPRVARMPGDFSVLKASPDIVGSPSPKLSIAY